MKTIIYVFALLFVGLSAREAFSQQAASKPHADVVIVSPNADRDIATGIAYVNALAAGDWAKVRSLLAPGFMQYGPGSLDSADASQYAEIWQERYKTQTEREVMVIASTSLRVKEGYVAGDWVMLWFDYKARFTNENKTLHIPVQITMRMENGKVAVDREYFDGGTIYRQLGWTLTPPK